MEQNHDNPKTVEVDLIRECQSCNGKIKNSDLKMCANCGSAVGPRE